MKWTQIKVKCKPDVLDTVCAVMSMTDSHLQIEDFSDVIEYNPVYGELIDEELLKRRDEAAVSIYISADSNAAEISQQIEERLSHAGAVHETEIISLDEQDWADNWKQYYKPVKIGRRLVIVPEWETYSASDEEIVVTMDPGMAFGTGTHESTQLCAALLEEYLPAGAHVIDIGTGSGILAICASKLGASLVEAYDIDPMAVRIAGENAVKNGCQNIRCGCSDLLAAVNGIYDFAVANITSDIICRMAPVLGRYLRSGALTALSGIIDEQRDRVMAAMIAGGFEAAGELHANGWTGLLMRYKG